MKSDLVIVYHRQPYEEVEREDGTIELVENKSPNGIVPTLKGFLGRAEHASWVAWKYADDPVNPQFERTVEISDSYGDYSVTRLPLTRQQVSSFYHVSSKEAFWPILHGFKERYNYDPVDWPTFREVNWAFAEAAAEEASDDAVIWVHDYNLWLVPAYLRQLKPSAKIAFFHHTPFPAPDMFNVLPWREEIIRSLLECDAVGFHIPRYARNFLACCRSQTSAKTGEEKPTEPALVKKDSTALSERVTPVSIDFKGRTILVDVNPVGVNYEYISDLAQRPEVEKKVAEIRKNLGDCKLVVSISRTDYTKGNIEQLETFERLLRDHPEWRGKVRLMLVSVASNRSMAAYEEIQGRIENLTGRINGTFGNFEWQPVSLISTAIPLEDLVAYYRAADVASITPLADGLNLVCSEYCVAQDEERPGVLILSEFAGAAVLLNGAIPVNPFSHRSMDRGLEQALAMGPTERCERMKQLKECAARFTNAKWTDKELELFAKMRGMNRSAAA